MFTGNWTAMDRYIQNIKPVSYNVYWKLDRYTQDITPVSYNVYWKLDRYTQDITPVSYNVYWKLDRYIQNIKPVSYNVFSCKLIYLRIWLSARAIGLHIASLSFEKE